MDTVLYTGYRLKLIDDFLLESKPAAESESEASEESEGPGSEGEMILSAIYILQ